jgi:hypothetical protein
VSVSVVEGAARSGRQRRAGLQQDRATVVTLLLMNAGAPAAPGARVAA